MYGFTFCTHVMYAYYCHLQYVCCLSLQGYSLWPEPAYRDYFLQHAVQMPLQVGDAIFFVPSLHHAAGANCTTNLDRVANLIQVSSAFGKTMEIIDMYKVAECVYPALLRQWPSLSDLERDAIITACCDDYAFPTNLDRDPPIEGKAPYTHAHITRGALDEGCTLQQYSNEMKQLQERRA